MLIQHKRVHNKGMFYIEEDGNILAEMVYSEKEPNQMIIEHTEVSRELRGRNVGYELVHRGVEYARENHLKVLPVCPFAKSVFDKKPDFQDVLA